MTGAQSRLSTAVQTCCQTGKTGDELAKLIAEAFTTLSVKVIACDFDGTFANKQLLAQPRSVINQLPNRFMAKDMELLRKNLDCTFTITTFSDPQFGSARDDTVAGCALIEPFAAAAKLSLDKIIDFYPYYYDTKESMDELADRLGVDRKIIKQGFDKYGNSKNIHLLLLCHEYGVLPEEILMIDDDVKNCKQAVQFGSMAILAHTGGPKGFNFANMSCNPREWR